MYRVSQNVIAIIDPPAFRYISRMRLWSIANDLERRTRSSLAHGYVASSSDSTCKARTNG
jgi:hypothetical protein